MESQYEYETQEGMSVATRRQPLAHAAAARAEGRTA